MKFKSGIFYRDWDVQIGLKCYSVILRFVERPAQKQIDELNPYSEGQGCLSYFKSSPFNSISLHLRKQHLCKECSAQHRPTKFSSPPPLQTQRSKKSLLFPGPCGQLFLRAQTIHKQIKMLLFLLFQMRS